MNQIINCKDTVTYILPNTSKAPAGTPCPDPFRPMRERIQKGPTSKNENWSRKCNLKGGLMNHLYFSRDI